MRAGLAAAPAAVEALRGLFLRRCIAWALPRGGELLWPNDRAAILELGVPCGDCLQVVHDLEGEPRHTLRVLMVEGGRHWSEGITVSCAEGGR